MGASLQCKSRDSRFASYLLPQDHFALLLNSSSGAISCYLLVILCCLSLELLAKRTHTNKLICIYL